MKYGMKADQLNPKGIFKKLGISTNKSPEKWAAHNHIGMETLHYLISCMLRAFILMHDFNVEVFL